MHQRTHKGQETLARCYRRNSVPNSKNTARLFKEAVNGTSGTLEVDDLVLAVVDAYPPVPAIISPDDQNQWKREVTVHLEFMEGKSNEKVTGWVSTNSITKYSRKGLSYKKVAGNNILYKAYTKAIQEANQSEIRYAPYD